MPPLSKGQFAEGELPSPNDAEYKKSYNRGWKASHSYTGRSSPLERADAKGEPNSWYDGYADNSAGREKWHMWHCNRKTLPYHCAEHNWKG